jgi:hypothetical protein
MTRTTILLATFVALGMPFAARAQPIGTFRWQFQPYCNVVTATVTQVGGIYRLEGTDDQCGGGRDLAAVQGLAFPNPDGSVGFGMTIVTPPGGAPVHVDAEISLATLSGTWRDSAGGTGVYAFTPGAGTGGIARPPAATAIPGSIRLSADGSILARADGDGPIPASGAGARMMWYSGKAAFRAGAVSDNVWDDASVGVHSAALGVDTVARGENSTAFGQETNALARNSTAMGFATTASGPQSVAMGVNSLAAASSSTAMGALTTASGASSTAMGTLSVASNDSSVAMGQATFANGPQSTAMGLGTRATGLASTAMGSNTTATGQFSLVGGSGSGAAGVGALAYGQLVFANGDGSVVLGSNAVAVPGAFGSFVFADRSTSTQLFSLNPNEFVVRAGGGITFFSNAAASAGVTVAPGGGSWSSVSDVHMKEHFRDLNGDHVLARIAEMPVREWNYKSQDASIRHIGPTAQDFRAAFGLGESDVRINTIDADGVALAGVKALEARTRALQVQIEALRQQLEALTTKAPH